MYTYIYTYIYIYIHIQKWELSWQSQATRQAELLPLANSSTRLSPKSRCTGLGLAFSLASTTSGPVWGRRTGRGLLDGTSLAASASAWSLERANSFFCLGLAEPCMYFPTINHGFSIGIIHICAYWCLLR